MKKIITTLIILLIWLPGQAQEGELFNNIWYLEFLESEGHSGPVAPPNSDEFETITLVFVTEGDSMYFRTGMCSDIEAEITSITIDQIFFDNYTCCGEDSCTEPENVEFEDEFASFFMWEDAIFYYITENPDGSLRLFLGNSIFSGLRFTNQVLSTSEVSKPENNFQIAFQNDELIIKSSTVSANSVVIYNLKGQIALPSTAVLNNRVKTSGLTKGIYVVKIKDKEGRVFTKKVRKE